MGKQRGYADQRGMGAQSDFISQVFVPGEQHRAHQVKIARVLIDLGVPVEEAALMLSIPQTSISGDEATKL